MKRFYKLFATWFLCLFLVLSQFIVSLADVKSLMISSNSNAVMMFATPRSSIGTVVNTVTESKIPVRIQFRSNATGTTFYRYVDAVLTNNRFKIERQDAPDGYVVTQIGVVLTDDYLPNNGDYYFGADYSSDISYNVNRSALWYQQDFKNSNNESGSYWLDDYVSSVSGDIYISNFPMRLGNISQMILYSTIYPSENVTVIGGTFALSFVRTEFTEDGTFHPFGGSISSSDYQQNISSSLSDLSSSVNDVSEGISGITEAIENLQGAMEPHYSNVLTQLHHITEQLHAFYDQIYNNIHLKEYALWQDIKTAIENIDLEVNVNLDKLKTSIDNMSQAVQNKLQSVTDTITGGYNNIGMQENNNELSGALDELDNAEQEVLDDVNGYIEGFEYPSFDGISSGIIGALSFFGGFLHSIFLGMGGFGLIITFSLTMIFVLIIVGYHRIRS